MKNEEHKNKLTIELVPKTSWYTNVRSKVSKEKWDILRKECYRQAGYKCEICSGKGEKWPVECHELWEYDDVNKIQRLKGLIALCPDCHTVKHIGLAGINGKGEFAAKHLAKVNKISSNEAHTIIDEAFETWRKRSSYKWEVDISWLDNEPTEYEKHGVDVGSWEFENLE